jgi:hypothetical protein
VTNHERERSGQGYEDEGGRMDEARRGRPPLPARRKDPAESARKQRKIRGAHDQPGDDDGGMGGHMGAEDVGNDFGRYGGTRTAPEHTKQNANPTDGADQ